MIPKYTDITNIMFDIMLQTFELELEYARTRDPNLLPQIEYLSCLIDFWEEQLYKIYGINIFDIRDFLW